jgi:hypothetical protein
MKFCIYPDAIYRNKFIFISMLRRGYARLEKAVGYNPQEIVNAILRLRYAKSQSYQRAFECLRLARLTRQQPRGPYPPK